MSTLQTPVRDLPAAARAAVIARAAALLREGGLVVIPTETVYGIAASGAVRAAVEKLAEVARRPGAWTGQRAADPFSTWHAPSTAAVRDVLRLKHPVHRRLLARLAPGPVRFLVEAAPEELSRIERELGALPGVVTGHGADTNAGVVAVRIPDHEVTAAAIEQSRTPVVAVRMIAAGWGQDREPSGALTDERAARAGVGLVIDDGETRLGRGSTTVRLLSAGGYEVVEPGAYEERYIRKRLERSILFICTGNTCRSPMAEVIARGIVAQTPEAVPTRISSAGVAAAEGDRPAPEGWDVLRAMGFEPGVHRSRELTRQMIAEADVIYGMTASHVRAVLSIDPTAAAKVRQLDPAGGDVPDPIGGGREIYRKTAERLAELIRARSAEWAEE